MECILDISKFVVARLVLLVFHVLDLSESGSVCVLLAFLFVTDRVRMSLVLVQISGDALVESLNRDEHFLSVIDNFCVFVSRGVFTLNDSLHLFVSVHDGFLGFVDSVLSLILGELASLGLRDSNFSAVNEGSSVRNGVNGIAVRRNVVSSLVEVGLVAGEMGEIFTLSDNL